MMKELTVACFPEGGLWVAQCLDVDIAAQAEELGDLAQRFADTLSGHIEICLYEGLEPVASLPQTPTRVRMLPITDLLDFPDARPWKSVEGYFPTIRYVRTPRSPIPPQPPWPGYVLAA